MAVFGGDFRTVGDLLHITVCPDIQREAVISKIDTAFADYGIATCIPFSFLKSKEELKVELDALMQRSHQALSLSHTEH